MTRLHTGKRLHEAKTMVTEGMHDELIRLAAELKCTPGELVNDAIFLAVTGKTFSEHVANDRRIAFHVEGRDQGDNKAAAKTPASPLYGVPQ